MDRGKHTLMEGQGGGGEGRHGEGESKGIPKF